VVPHSASPLILSVPILASSFFCLHFLPAKWLVLPLQCQLTLKSLFLKRIKHAWFC
jgi:hypothetical protein